MTLEILTLLSALWPLAPDGDVLAPATVSDLRAFEETLSAAAEKALPAMVFIDGGSGVLISPEGYILTNHHVIAGLYRAGRREDLTSSVQLTARLLGGRPLRATIVGRDPAGDIALLKANDPGPYPFLELGDSDQLRVGQWVLAMGNPFLLGESAFAFSGPGDFSPSVSLGVVSALHRSSDMYPDAIQVDVAVNPGSSGGPLLTTDGKVVGINGKIQTRFLFIQVNSGVGYAVPSSQIRRFLEPLRQASGGIVRRGKLLGIAVDRRGEAEKGLAVTRIEAESPGARAGFKAGDRILSIDGHPVWSRRRFDGLLETYPAGSRVKVLVGRGEERAEIAAVLDPQAPGRLGVTVKPAGGERGGVRITELAAGAPAIQSGLQVGDVIRRLNGQRLQTVADLHQAIETRVAGDTVTLVIERDGRREEKTIRLDARPQD